MKKINLLNETFFLIFLLKIKQLIDFHGLMKVQLLGLISQELLNRKPT